MVRFDCTTADGLRDAIAQTTRHAVTLDTLPDDVLARLLARVPLADRVSAGRVCKRWRTTGSSNAYAVARRACTEPVWLVMGGKSYYYDSENGGEGSIELSACSVLDVSLRKVAELAPRHFDWAGSAVIPGLGVLVFGGSGDEHPLIATAWVHDLKPGSSWRQWASGGWPCERCTICVLGESIYVNCVIKVDAALTGGLGDVRSHGILRFDKQGNLIENIDKPADIHPAVEHASYVHALDGRLFIFTQAAAADEDEDEDEDPYSFRLDSYDPETREWQRMPDPPIQAIGLNAAVLAGKLYVIGGEIRRLGVGRYAISHVQVFDGREWSVGPPLPSPSLCYNVSAVCNADCILALCQQLDGRLRDAFVLRDGVWRAYPCDHDTLPEGCSIAGGHYL